jgi:hypothetical protein
MMELPSFLLFTPVPPRSQHNGWFPSLQRRFVVELARGAEPDEAARLVGKTRQTAYRLRTRAGGESFAAAWDEAQDFAREVKAAGQGHIPGSGNETLLVPRYYRGRLIGFVQREDVSGAMRQLARLDRLAQAMAAAGGASSLDEQRFDAFDRITRPGSYRSDAIPE